MNVRLYVLLYLYALLVLLAVSAFQSRPGYMDAEYYYANGLGLAQGQGFSEPFLWNYLDEPQGLPHPAFTYWMPLSSLLAAAGIELSGWINFYGAKIGFLLLAACIAPLTARLAFSFSKQRWAAWLAGFLAVFPGFYLAFLGTTDTFGITMLLGLLWLWVAHRTLSDDSGERSLLLNALALGLVSGLMHLTRADGLLWLGMGGIVAGMAVLISKPQGQGIQQSSRRIGITLLVFLLIGVGYSVTMLPWIWRNLAIFGTPLAPGGGKVLWLTDYDDIYLFPASILAAARWWSTGLGEIIRARLWALGQNFQTALAVQGMVFLMPLSLAGAWQLRNDRRVQLGVLAWGLIFLIFVLVFPYPGARGGFFHSGAALQPLWWALVPSGLAVFIAWGERRRSWRPEQARVILGVGLIGLAAVYSVIVTWPKVIGEQVVAPAWGQSGASYLRLESHLDSLGVPREAIRMVNNPPGHFAATGRMAIVIPDGDVDMLVSAARRYHAGYLLLDENYPQGLAELFANPSEQTKLEYLGEFEQTLIFRIVTD